MAKRQREDNVNNTISELVTLIPECMLDPNRELRCALLLILPRN
jgi:hypothetical protein